MAGENNDLISGLGAGAMQLVADLSLASTTKAFYPTRMTTTQRDDLSPTAGAVIYNTTTNKLNMYNGTTWEAVTSA